MITPAEFIVAAERIWEGASFSCCVVGPPGCREAYQQIFRPGPLLEKDSYAWLKGLFDSDEEAKNWRVTALCFAAAMHEAGDLV